MTAKELKQILNQGIQPIVQAKENIHTYTSEEVCIDPGMIGKILRISTLYEGTEDEHYEFSIDIGSFEEKNISFMQKDFYDKQGNACLNYKEVGLCKDGIETLYLMPDMDVFDVVDNKNIKIFNTYKKSNTSVSYLEWLEEKYLESDKDLKIISSGETITIL